MSPLGFTFASAIAVFFADQATKALVARQSTGGGPWLGFVRRSLNAHGCGRSFGWRTLLALWVAEAVAIATIVHGGALFGNVVAQIGLGVALGGALGNVVDRAWHGAVVDFIDLGFWPSFNLGDAAIVAGTLLAAWRAY